jgi:hypothetical protein
MKTIKRMAALTGMALSLLAFLIVLLVLVKGWGLRTPLKEGVALLSGVAEQALQRLEGGTVRLRAPLDRALVLLDQLDAAAREWGDRLEAERPQSAQLLVILNDRFSREIEAAVQIGSAIGEAAVVFNKSLETINRFSRMEVPTLTDELAKSFDRFREVESRLQEFRDSVEGLKAGVVQTGVEAITTRTQRFREPLLRIQKALKNTENLLASKRNGLIELEGNLLYLIDLGIFGLCLLCPLLLAGQVSLIRASWRMFRRQGKGGT